MACRRAWNGDSDMLMSGERPDLPPSYFPTLLTRYAQLELPINAPKQVTGGVRDLNTIGDYIEYSALANVIF